VIGFCREFYCSVYQLTRTRTQAPEATEVTFREGEATLRLWGQACVYVCLRERQRQRERDREKGKRERRKEGRKKRGKEGKGIPERGEVGWD
jgi:hypothetical protein